MRQEGNPSDKELRLPPPPPPLALPPPPPPAPPEPVIIREPMYLPAPPQPIVARPPVPQRAPFDEEAMALPRPPARAERQSNEPALVIDLTTGEGGKGGAAATDDEAVRATLIHNRASVVPQGAIIAAVLETPLNSDRPGLARAIVAKDARGFDGTRVLIPRGSRLIGEFKADSSPGLRRVLITWNRMIRPDGVAIRIGSPVADKLGQAGVPGSVNTHFFEKFASAVLQSALTVGTNLASTLPVGNTSAIYVGLPNQATQLGQQLIPNASRPPTVKVKAGAEIAVMVARDLDFAGTPAVR